MDELVDGGNLEVQLIEKLDIAANDDEFAQWYSEKISNLRYDMITLENGTEGMFVRPGDLDPSKKHPMLLIIHGGPFSASPFHMFLSGRQTLLL